jgi:hypothetical protein
MNNSTQEIISAEQAAHFEKVLGKKAFKRQFTEIPDSDLDKLHAMNRHDRRAWLAEHGPKKKRLK